MNNIKNFVLKIIAISLLMVLAYILFENAEYFRPKEVFEKDVLRLVVDDKDVTNKLPHEIYVKDNVVMMSRTTAMKYFDNIYIHHDEKYDVVTITSNKMVGKIKIGENKIKVNGEERKIDGTALFSGEELFIPISSIEDVTEVDIDYNEKVVATTPRGWSRVKVAISPCEQKLKGYKREVSLTNGIIESGEELYIFDTENKKNEDYITVRNVRGDIGYIMYQKIQAANILYFNQGTEIQKKEAYDEIKYSLVWEYAENYTPDRSNEKKNKAIDIISPTWLYLKDDKGNIKSTIDKKYFEWAKSENYAVWPTLKNDLIKIEELSTIMNDMQLRDTLIDNVVDYAVENKLDGINIDIEYMYESDKDEFSQFVRELSSNLRRNKVVVSVDVTIPGGSPEYSLCYDRKALAKAVDYMMLMAYDQYGNFSNNAGPTASLSWVEANIQTMLGYEGVDNDKLFLCVPFYSRYWVVNSDTNQKKSTEAINMKTANNYLEKYKEYAKWSEIEGQYYIEVPQKDSIIKIWIENEDSLKEKIELINKYDLAGVAAWRWGFEDDKAFSTIDETMNIQ